VKIQTDKSRKYFGVVRQNFSRDKNRLPRVPALQCPRAVSHALRYFAVFGRHNLSSCSSPPTHPTHGIGSIFMASMP
jgi:hypothetical protein